MIVTSLGSEPKRVFGAKLLDVKTPSVMPVAIPGERNMAAIRRKARLLLNPWQAG
jgi:hypothetical protein